MKLTSRASLQIQKSIEEVFEGIVNPTIMTKYFISESTGRLESGKDIEWKFPEFDPWYAVTNVNVEENSSISFVWDPDTVVHIDLESRADGSTVVRVKEGAKQQNEENMKWLVNNTGGWANFLASMKAYLEHGVCLRTGAYDFLAEKA